MIIYKRTVATILAAALIFLTACGVSNDDDPPITPDAPYQIADEEHQQDEEEIADGISLEQRIDNYIEMYDHNIRGLAISIFTKDDMILEIEYGYADVEAERAVDADTVFEWGSVTKLLVWISVMQLYERGELDLHADIFTYIPEAYFSNIIYPTTMFHLMHHTAGFDDIGDFEFNNMGFGMVGDAVPTFEAILKDMTAFEFAAQSWQPGERVKYSNYGTILAGYVVQRVSGVPFHEYVHNNIFAPLDMHHTALSPDLSDNEWVREQREKIRVYDMWGLLFTQRLQGFAYPAGAAVGTISDMVKFARALMPDENGGTLLFEYAETLSMLHPSLEAILNTPVCELSNATFLNGFDISTDQSRDPGFARVIGHAGGSLGFRSFLYIDIDWGVGLVMSENTMHGLASADGFFRFFAHEIPELALGM